MPSSSTCVVSKCTIYRDQKSRIKKLRLSVSDLPMLSCQYIQKVVLLSNPPYSVTQFVSLLKQSLFATLSHFPALAGCLITDSEGSFHNKLHYSPYPIGSVNICPPPIIPQSKEHFLTPTSAQGHANPIHGTSFYSGYQVHNQLADLFDESISSTLHKQTGTIIPPTESCQELANPIQCQTFCCGGDHVHNQQTNVAVEPVNSPQHNQIGTVLPPTESPQEHANPIQCQTFCCSGDDVPNQQTDPPVNSPLHNQTDNASASLDIEAGGDIEARGASSNETSSSDVDNEVETSSPQTGNQNPPPDDDDGIDQSASNGANTTAPNEDHKGKKEVVFVFMVGGQIIATGIAAFALNNASDVSSEAKVLQTILIGCMFVSLTSLFYGLWLSVYKPHSLAAWVVRVIGHVAMAFTLLIATALNLPNNLMLWGTLGICTVCFPAIILYAIKIA